MKRKEVLGVNQPPEPQTPRRKREHPPTIAPGMENDELDRPATDEEKQRGDVTRVTELFLDRAD